MSYQTKQQVIGYMIKACLDSELIIDIARAAAETIPAGTVMTNDEAYEYVL